MGMGTILIVGAGGRLGGVVARRLLAEGTPVRALSRTPAKLADLRALGADVVAGDLRDPASLARACAGVDAVLAAAHAFVGNAGGNVPAAVDDAGNRHLMDAARAAGVRHFVLMSILGTRADHPIDLFRCKHAAEQYLRASGLSYTILRPTAFMEMWAEIIGGPISHGQKALIFGRGVNPVNFVSVADVARFAHLALADPRARDRVIEIGGPENLSLLEMAATIERVTGRTTGRRHIPLPMMRVMGALARPINPAFSRQVRTGVLMDTQDMTFDPGPTLAAFPMTLTRLEDVVRNQYTSAVAVDGARVGS
ncbi:MAG TPA: SDR family oxidoreductase [Ktedonobacterales bacterium]|nr:SDR family oxidoreductase [Ktedonobacterales bacterium]